MPFYRYADERTEATTIVLRAMDQSGLQVPRRVREVVERAVTDDLVEQAVAQQGSVNRDEKP